jgi:hypothetical protein
MTVWAKYPKIFETVITPVPVDVIELERDWLSQPLAEMALLANPYFQALREEFVLEFEALYMRLILKQHRYWLCDNDGHTCVFSPALPVKMSRIKATQLDLPLNGRIVSASFDQAKRL